MILNFDSSSRSEEDNHDYDEDVVDGRDDDEYVNVTMAGGLPGDTSYEDIDENDNHDHNHYEDDDNDNDNHYEDEDDNF